MYKKETADKKTSHESLSCCKLYKRWERKSYMP